MNLLYDYIEIKIRRLTNIENNKKRKLNNL